MLDDKKGLRVAVIGAGPSGIAALKNLLAAGFTQVTAFEKNTQVGGNWIYDEREGHSSVYESTHSISSKRWSEYEDFWMPDGYPEYPSHKQLLHYFELYAKHFNLLPHIEFNTEVLSVKKTDQGTWSLTLSQGSAVKESCFDILFVANGHHWDPIMPKDPGDFSGQIMHAHQYKTAQPFKDKRVLVVGGGNSACDLAVEIARKASNTCISMRRGYHIVPKFIFGKPTDVAVAKIRWMPSWLKQKVMSMTVRAVQGEYRKYGLQEPDCGPLEIHPTINSELLYFIRHGRIHPKPAIDHFSAEAVHFSDGSVGYFDVVIYATGYQISFPFFDKDFIDLRGATQLPFYKKMIHPDHDTLYFIGLCQPQGCIWPLSDYQSRVAVQMILGRVKKPKNLQQAIEKELKRPHYRFKESTRHALEVDYHAYKRELLALL